MARDEQERPLWKLNRDEQRVLLITFVGGLASIIAAAVIIGSAIAIARYERSFNSSTGLAAGTIATGGFAIWSIYELLSPPSPELLPSRRPKGLAGRLVVLYMFTLTAPTFCILILTWIGIAAGVH